MNQDLERFLNLRHFPQRVTMEQGAGILGVSPHEMPMLIAKGMLKPLGHPAPNGQKFFLSATLEDLRRDDKWWNKASDTILQHWRYKNNRKGQVTTDELLQFRQSADARKLADA
jgi:hypothetical protein